MFLFEFIKQKLCYKQHTVHYAGKKFKIYNPRFKKPSETPQRFVDQHAVVCGNCGEIILPSDEVWFKVPTLEDLQKPGVLKFEVEGKTTLVCCLARNCVGTAGFMCGRLEENRQVESFESPIHKALRTGEVTIVSDMKTYKG